MRNQGLGFSVAVRITMTMLAIAFTAGHSSADEPAPSTPTSALTAFYQAVYAGDAATAGVYVTDPATFGPLVAGLADAMSARRELSEAGVTAFGKAGANLGGEDSASLIERVKASDVKTDGDDATVTPPGGGKAVKLHRSSGVWKLDLASTFGPDALDRKAAVQHAIAKAARQTTEDVKKGTYKSANDAKAAFAKNRETALSALSPNNK